MTFETALSGLNASTADLDVIGNNIANTGTTGFKASRAEFADIFATTNLGVSQNAVGQGVRLSGVTQQFTQGQFAFTGNNLDLAVNGNGFFQLNDNGQNLYTRAGMFSLDREGYVVDGNGRQLMGYMATNGVVGGAATALRINTGDVAPAATTLMDMTANLQATETAPAVTPFDSTDPDSYNFSTSTTVYDSLGRAHLTTFYFVKTATANEWEIYAELAGDPGGAMGPNVATFNTDGTIADVDGVSPPVVNYTISAAAVGSPIAGAADLDIDMDFRNVTQFGTPFSVTTLNQDGYSAGQFSSLTIEKNGIIFGRFSNGQSTILGQVILAQFPSPQNLSQVGDTAWAETFGSGQPLIDAPGGSGLGTLQSGSLEQSNVNLTEQLVKMITAQRNYQANAKMISTQDALTQEILNISR